MLYTYKFPRPMVTVDILLLQEQAGLQKILLIKREQHPFRGQWALPGGYVDHDEGLEAAAHRELQEETSLRNLHLRQLGAFGDPGRDPRGHTITVVYGSELPPEAAVQPRAGDDAKEARWFPLEALPELAFDHDKIIESCLKRMESGKTE